MTQIKVFEAPNRSGIETQVNTWLRDNEGKITIIKVDLAFGLTERSKQYAYSILFEENTPK